ncbi:hypothetical protein ACFLV5_06380 [Chloroflexota bacterium]
MRGVAKLTAFVLLIIGTLGILINEFIFDWGRVATMVFAIVNFIGLATLAATYLRMRNKDHLKEDYQLCGELALLQV